MVQVQDMLVTQNHIYVFLDLLPCLVLDFGWLAPLYWLLAFLLVFFVWLYIYIYSFQFWITWCKMWTGNWDIITIYRGSKLRIIELQLCIDVFLKCILSHFWKFLVSQICSFSYTNCMSSFMQHYVLTSFILLFMCLR